MDLYPLSIAFKFISWNLGFRLFFIASMTDSLVNGNLSSAVTAPKRTMFKAKTLPASIASCVPSIGRTCLKFSFNVFVMAANARVRLVCGRRNNRMSIVNDFSIAVYLIQPPYGFNRFE